jgi:hypothetical protein
LSLLSLSLRDPSQSKSASERQVSYLGAGAGVSASFATRGRTIVAETGDSNWNHRLEATFCFIS